MKRNKNRLEVAWLDIDSKRKTPFLRSTVATSDLIAVLAIEHETIEDVYHAINYDPEAKTILKHYIERGHGGKIAKNYFGK